MKSNSQKIKETNLIQKSTPLLSITSSGLTLLEFKLLDIYLSKIDSHDPSQRKVVFTVEELRRVLGVTQIKPKDLKEKLTHLMSQVVELRDERKKDGFMLLNLFSHAYCEKDEMGEWKVELSCSAEAREYIFNVESLGYLKYKLRSISKLTSRYSYVLFLYLETNKFRRTWSVPLDELKHLLNCADDEYYSEFKRFNSRILKPSQEEIEEKTALQYQYTPIRANRKVTEIQFSILQSENTIYIQLQEGETKNDETKEEESRKTDLDNESDVEQEPYYDCGDDFAEYMDFICSACNGEFSRAEMRCILNILETRRFHQHPLDKPGLPRFARYQYLSYWYNHLNAVAEKTIVKNRFAYFKAMIQKDMEEYAKNNS